MYCPSTIRLPPRRSTNSSRAAHALSVAARHALDFASAPRTDKLVPRIDNIDASSFSPHFDAPETRRVQDMRAMHLRVRIAKLSNDSVALGHKADGWSPHAATQRGQEGAGSGEQEEITQPRVLSEVSQPRIPSEVSQPRVPSVESLPRDMLRSPAPGNIFKAHVRLRPALRASPQAAASEAGVKPCEDRHQCHSTVKWDSVIESSCTIPGRVASSPASFDLSVEYI